MRNLLLDVRDRFPRHRRLMHEVAAAGLASRRRHVELRDVALAAAVHGRVHRETEAGVSGGDRAFDVIVHPAAIAHQIQLEYLRRRADARNRFEVRQTHRTQNHHRAERIGRFRNRRAAARVEHLNRSDRRQHHRNAQAMAAESRRSHRRRHVVQHARPERERIDRHAIALERRFGVGAADRDSPSCCATDWRVPP